MGCLLSPKSLLVADPTRIGWALRGDERTLGAQGYHAKQVVNQHVPQHDRLDLLQTTDQKLLKSPVTARRVGPFRLKCQKPGESSRQALYGAPKWVFMWTRPPSADGAREKRGTDT